MLAVLTALGMLFLYSMESEVHSTFPVPIPDKLTAHLAIQTICRQLHRLAQTSQTAIKKMIPAPALSGSTSGNSGAEPCSRCIEHALFVSLHASISLDGSQCMTLHVWSVTRGRWFLVHAALAACCWMQYVCASWPICLTARCMLQASWCRLPGAWQRLFCASIASCMRRQYAAWFTLRGAWCVRDA